MARPAKSTAAKTGAITKEDELQRQVAERLMQGSSEDLVAPDYLTDSQKQIFDFIMDNLEESRILGNVDLYVLTQGAITIDRLTTMEKMINDNDDLLMNTKFMATQDRVFKQFARICNELSLSPQSRAKISISVSKPDEKKLSILDVLNDDE